MIRQFYFGTLIALSVLAISIIARPSKEGVVRPLKAQEEFVAGIVILHRSNMVKNSAQFTLYFEALCDLTGVSVKEGRKIISSYMEKPQKWDATLKDIDTYLLDLMAKKNSSADTIPLKSDSLFLEGK